MRNKGMLFLWIIFAALIIRLAVRKRKKKYRKVPAYLLLLGLLFSVLPSASLPVQAANVPSLVLKSTQIVIGEKKQIRVKNRKGVFSNAKISYQSKNPAVASVTKKGKVIGKKAGNTKIFVMVRKGRAGKKLTYKVSVKKPEVSRKKLTFAEGEIQKITIINKPKKNANPQYVWFSDNNSIARVDNGRIYGISEGTTGIKVKVWANGKLHCTLRITVYVRPAKAHPDGQSPVPTEPTQAISNPNHSGGTAVAVTGISLNKDSIVLEEGESEKLTAFLQPENAKTQPVRWSSADTSVATVKDGIVIGKRAGRTMVTAVTDNGYTAVCSVTVKESGNRGNGQYLGTLFSNISGVAADTREIALFTLDLQNQSAGKSPVILKRDSVSMGNMHDDGKAGDAVAADGIYSLEVICQRTEEAIEEYTAECAGTFSNAVKIRYFGEITQEALLKQEEYIHKIQDIEKDYDSTDGDMEGLLDEVYQEALLGEQKGDIIAVSKEEEGISVQFSSGIWYIYQPVQEGTDAAGEQADVSVMTLQPFKSDYTASDDRRSTEATDGSAQKIAGHFSKYVFDKNYDNQMVTVDVMKNLSANQIVFCHTHGYYNSELGPMLWLGETVHPQQIKNGGKYREDFVTGRIVLTQDNRVGITSGFVEKYTGRLDNSFLYLGACLSGKDARLANSFLKKGAGAVIANSETIWRSYNCLMMRDVANGLLMKEADAQSYCTLAQALAYARKINGENDYEYYKNNDHAPSTPLIFGNKDYRLMETETVEVSQIMLDRVSLILEEGKTETLKAAVHPDNAADKHVTWSSSNTRIAAVSEGKVTGVEPGTAIITANSSNGKTASCTVVVREKAVPLVVPQSITLSQTNMTVAVGSSETLTAVIMPDNSTDKRVTWKSSNEKAVSISDGTVTAIAPGKAVVTAKTCNGITASCSVTVTASIVPAAPTAPSAPNDPSGSIEATGIMLNKTSLNLDVGKSETLLAAVIPGTADQHVTWSSSDVQIAVVSDGKVTGIAPGNAVITAQTANGKTDTCRVTVHTKTLRLNYSEITLYAQNYSSMSLFTLDEGAEGAICLEPDENEKAAGINVRYNFSSLPQLQLYANIDGEQIPASMLDWSSKYQYGFGDVDDTGNVKTGASYAGFVATTAKPSKYDQVVTVALKSDPSVYASVTIHYVFDARLRFSIADESIATVDEYGVVHRVAPYGETTLTMESELTGEKKTCKVWIYSEAGSIAKNASLGGVSFWQAMLDWIFKCN